MTLNYFTCTLGQAALQETPQGQWNTVNELIDEQSSKNQERPAVGFAYSGAAASSPSTLLYSFKDLKNGSNRAAKKYQSNLEEADIASGSTVALLSSSTPEFLFTWLALLRLGFSVLLIAPQNQPEAILHLCKTCSVELLVFDELYEALAEGTAANAGASGFESLSLVKIPFSVHDDDFTAGPQTDEINVGSDKRRGEDIAYLFHTSGTSSGLPKPIPQTHHGAAQALPSFEDGWKVATYSTTPLYHGGISDCLRAWSSNALIWLFPGKEPGLSKKPLSITAPNILACLRAIDEQHAQAAPVKYFTSVPYILQMMSSNPEGLDRLQSLDCVGVGGAALPEEVGNKLVDQGVNLVSRYGSAECGFLLSSHRDYEHDKAWQYLRADTGIEHLAFEPQDDNKFEVVVKPGWPHLAKTNRADGSYATSDLMTRHPSIPNAWRYDSRADAQLTLITGKKFDPSPLEGAIASSSLLDDVLIFGNGQPFPGALLFRSSEFQSYSDDDLVKSIAPHIEMLNSRSQPHARIPRNMLVPIAYGANQLQKSSKGTILRNRAEETYGELIASTYERLSSPVNDAVPDAEIPTAIREAVWTIVGNDIGIEDDLFAHGVDSLGSIQIRLALRRLLPKEKAELPMTIVEDCGNISNLSDFILQARRGETPLTSSADNEIKLMHQLVEKYSVFPPAPSPESRQERENQGATILLTGATGALGAHLLAQYRADPLTIHIICLVRGADAHAATERVQKSLASRRLPTLEPNDNKVTVMPCKLSDPSLGLEPTQYAELQDTVTLVVHAAWAVNFRWRLASFEKDHIVGTAHLLSLCLSSTVSPPPSFIFCSSVASVSATKPAPDTPPYTLTTIPELVSTNPADANPLGYSRSKWVTESIIAAAACARPDVSMQILRIGQLSGDTVHGIWNETEAWPLMLGSMRATGCLPDLGDEALGWLGVDLAAEGIRQTGASLHTPNEGDTVGDDGEAAGDAKEGEVPVRHILNPDRSATWRGALQWLRYFGEEFEVVEPSEWIKRLEKLEGEGDKHPALRLLGMWRERYGGKDRQGEGVGQAAGLEDERVVRFDIMKGKEAAPIWRSVEPVDEVYFRKLWEWVRENVGG